MTTELPFNERSSAHLPGHWLLARVGKRVLRPGGLELTSTMLAAAQLRGADVVELAPGLGKTATAILDQAPASYRGIESDASAAHISAAAVGDRGSVLRGEASATGVDAESADVVIGEAMLTMQTDKHKSQIATEAQRILRPGGRYAIHELALTPDSLDASTKTEIQRALARSIKVNARPLTEAEWRKLLEEAGFDITEVNFAPMALLQPRRLLADEGPRGVARIVRNLAKDRDARARVLDMRRTFRTHRKNLVAISIIATKR